MSIPSIVKVISMSDYELKITFDDGYETVIEFSEFIKDGVSSKLRDIDYFKSVFIEDGFIRWENGFDFCPLYLYNLGKEKAKAI